MPSQVTVSLPTGPGSSVSSLVITPVAQVIFDPVAGVLTVVKTDNSRKTFDFSGAATVTYTISGGNSTVAVS